MLRTLRHHLRANYLIGALDGGVHVNEPDAWDIHHQYDTHVYDVVTSAKLNPDKVVAAHEEEMAFLPDWVPSQWSPRQEALQKRVGGPFCLTQTPTDSLLVS